MPQAQPMCIQHSYLHEVGWGHGQSCAWGWAVKYAADLWPLFGLFQMLAILYRSGCLHVSQGLQSHSVENGYQCLLRQGTCMDVITWQLKHSFQTVHLVMCNQHGRKKWPLPCKLIYNYIRFYKLSSISFIFNKLLNHLQRVSTKTWCFLSKTQLQYICHGMQLLT